MLRFSLFACLLLAFPGPAAAQAADVADALEDDGLEEGHHLPDVGDTNTTLHSGLSLTISGLTTAALGMSLLFTFVAWGIPGGTFTGLGGLLALAGIPTWIAGGIRREVLRARPEDRLRVGNDYEQAGIAVTSVGLAMSLAGLALLMTGLFTPGYDDPLNITGVALIPTGFLIAHFIGIPMWCEGARF